MSDELLEGPAFAMRERRYYEPLGGQRAALYYRSAAAATVQTCRSNRLAFRRVAPSVLAARFDESRNGGRLSMKATCRGWTTVKAAAPPRNGQRIPASKSIDDGADLQGIADGTISMRQRGSSGRPRGPSGIFPCPDQPIVVEN